MIWFSNYSCINSLSIGTYSVKLKETKKKMSSVPYVQSLFNFSLLSRAPRTILQCFFGNNLKFFMLNNKLLMFKLLLEKILTIGFILVNFQGAVQTVVGLIQSPFLLFYLVYRFYILLLTCLCDSRKEDRDVVRLQLQNYYFRYQQEHLSVQIRSNEKLYNYHSLACDEYLRLNIQVLSPRVQTIQRIG